MADMCENWLQIGCGFPPGIVLPRPGAVTECGDGLHVIVMDLSRRDPGSSFCRCNGVRFEGRITGGAGTLAVLLPDGRFYGGVHA